MENRFFLGTSCSPFHSSNSLLELRRCHNSDIYYFFGRTLFNGGSRSSTRGYQGSTSKPCPNDTRSYEACTVLGLAQKIGYRLIYQLEPFCGRVIELKDNQHNLYGLSYGYYVMGFNRETDFQSKINHYFAETGVNAMRACDGYCGEFYTCADDFFCNGVQYGIRCNITLGDHSFSSKILPRDMCDGILHCPSSEDERGCTLPQTRLTITEQYKYNSIVYVKTAQLCITRGRPANAGKYDDTIYSDNHLEYNGGPKIRSEKYILTNDTVRCSSLQYYDEFYKKSITNLRHRRESAENTPFGPICKFYLDQTNCTDPHRAAISCKISGFLSTVAKSAICVQNPGLCDDGFDSLCNRTSIACFVHKHQLCDGIADCFDQSDENSPICQSMTKSLCFRRYQHVDKLPIPVAWLGDGFYDCENGNDEKKIWPTCGIGNFNHIVNEETSVSCPEVFICGPGSSDFVELHKLCVGDDTCGHQKLCAFEQAPNLDLYSIQRRNAKPIETVSYCLQGVTRSLSFYISPCVEENFNPANIFGIEDLSAIMIPNTIVDCKNLFGKAYIYMSCSGKCIDSPQCPLKAPKYDGCTFEDSQYMALAVRVFTVSVSEETSQLTFAFKNKDSGKYENNFFQCNNDRCITFGKVCNLIDDCGDGSDETICSNNFHCDNPRRFIPRQYKCDGEIHCNDYSDECNSDCGKTIIPSMSLMIHSWIVGSAAVIFNSVKLFKSIKHLMTNSYEITLNDKVLTVILHFGDFITGAYLLSIAVVDSVIYGSSYCKERFKWISSHECAFLGVASTFGAHISLLSMTFLSVFRAIGTTKMQIYASRNSAAKMSFIVVIIVTVSFFLAYAPLIEKFEDFFVNGMTYTNAEIKIFPAIVSKKIHLLRIQGYFGKIRLSLVKTWKKINQLTDEMFTNHYGGLGRRKIHFYGNDGVCLFKYFVSPEDPQKAYVWGFISWKIICFIVIFISYTKVLVFSKDEEEGLRSRRQSRDEETQSADQQRRETTKHITAVILTDFLCWIPFIGLCASHYFEVIDATPLYSTSSIVILPLNSMINPLLYSNSLTASAKKMLKKARYWLTRLTSYLLRRLLADNAHVNSERENDATRGMEMVDMSNQDRVKERADTNQLRDTAL